MPGTANPRPTRTAITSVNAVVWIEPGRALLVRGAADDVAHSIEVPIPARTAASPSALAAVAREVGDVDHVLVLGADELRTALEREIVAIGHRPETIRDAVLEGPIDTDILIGELRRLT